MNLEQINKKIDEGEKIIKIEEKVIEGLKLLSNNNSMVYGIVLNGGFLEHQIDLAIIRMDEAINDYEEQLEMAKRELDRLYKYKTKLEGEAND
jgi:hypothetical protein